MQNKTPEVVQPPHVITETTAERMKFINNYDFSFLYTRLSERLTIAVDEIAPIEAEFKKFLFLILFFDDPIAATSKKVDDFWHTFILFTPQYRAFCEQAFGQYIDHQPHSEKTPVPQRALTNLYAYMKDVFGSVNNLWLEEFTSEQQVDLLSGVVPAPITYKWSGWTGRNN